MTERYTIFSETGDEYRLQFTTDRSNIIADRILDLLQQDGIEVVEVGLLFQGGSNKKYIACPAIPKQRKIDGFCDFSC